MEDTSTVTLLQAKRAARSLAYRRRLLEGLPRIEETLRSFIRAKAAEAGIEKRGGLSALLGPYKVTLKGGELRVKEVNPIHPGQLKFKFCSEEVENGERNS